MSADGSEASSSSSYFKLAELEETPRVSPSVAPNVDAPGEDPSPVPACENDVYSAIPGLCSYNSHAPDGALPPHLYGVADPTVIKALGLTTSRSAHLALATARQMKMRDDGVLIFVDPLTGEERLLEPYSHPCTAFDVGGESATSAYSSSLHAQGLSGSSASAAPPIDTNTAGRAVREHSNPFRASTERAVSFAPDVFADVRDADEEDAIDFEAFLRRNGIGSDLQELEKAIDEEDATCIEGRLGGVGGEDDDSGDEVYEHRLRSLQPALFSKRPVQHPSIALLNAHRGPSSPLPAATTTAATATALGYLQCDYVSGEWPRQRYGREDGCALEPATNLSGLSGARASSPNTTEGPPKPSHSPRVPTTTNPTSPFNGMSAVARERALFLEGEMARLQKELTAAAERHKVRQREQEEYEAVERIRAENRRLARRQQQGGLRYRVALIVVTLVAVATFSLVYDAVASFVITGEGPWIVEFYFQLLAIAEQQFMGSDKLMRAFVMRRYREGMQAYTPDGASQMEDVNQYMSSSVDLTASDADGHPQATGGDGRSRFDALRDYLDIRPVDTHVTNGAVEGESDGGIPYARRRVSAATVVGDGAAGGNTATQGGERPAHTSQQQQRIVEDTSVQSSPHHAMGDDALPASPQTSRFNALADGAYWAWRRAEQRARRHIFAVEMAERLASISCGSGSGLMASSACYYGFEDGVATSNPTGIDDGVGSVVLPATAVDYIAAIEAKPFAFAAFGDADDPFSYAAYTNALQAAGEAV